MKKILQALLRMQAAAILWKYEPVVVAITGSVGKTSAKEAVFAVLKSSFRSRKSSGNFNTEVGVPLTIIGASSGGRNILRWGWVLLKGLLVFLVPLPYPRVLVLEMGADRPGDIAYLTALARPNIAIVTTVGESHLEFFGKKEKIAEEKAKLVSALDVSGVAVLNFDDELVQAMAPKHKGERIFYGLDRDADLFATDITDKAAGVNFKVHYRGNVVPVHLPGVIGKPSIYAALAGIAAGAAMKMNLVDISRALGAYQSPRGRLRLLPGVKQTLVVDDSYNSAPASAVAAINELSLLPGQRKIAVLGDMAELGEFTEEGHRQVGVAIVDRGINILITVGAKAKFISDQAVHMGYPESQILSFATSEDAQKPVEKLMHPGDVVLIKGSRFLHMEKIVKEIMAEPHRAGELLVH